MRLSVLAAQKFRFPPPTPPPPKRLPWRPSRSPWLSAPRSGAGPRRDFRPVWRGLLRGIRRLGLEISGRAGERGDSRMETARWCKAKQDGAGNSSSAPGRARGLPGPGVQSAPPLRPRTPGVGVPGGRGLRRRGEGWPWGGSGSARLRRAAAARSARLDAKAGGAAKLQRTDRAEPAANTRNPRPGPGAGNSAEPPASLEEKPSTVWSLWSFGRETPSRSPSPQGTRVQERLSGCKHSASILIYQTTPGWAWKRPSAQGKATSGKLIYIRADFPSTSPQEAVSASLPLPAPRVCSQDWQWCLGSCLPPTSTRKLEKNVNPGFRFLSATYPSRICNLGCYGATRFTSPKRCFSPNTLMPLRPTYPPNPFIAFRQSRPRVPNQAALTIS